MERQRMIVQRAKEFFSDRLDDVVHMVRQDRHELHGWEEPAPLRSVLRRALREGDMTETQTAQVAVRETELGCGAGEPEKGQQREELGHLLEAGATGLEKVARDPNADLTAEEAFGLECVLLLYGRPALLPVNGQVASVPAFWNVLEEQREDIELAQRGVGRIELVGHPDADWAGTGFLVSETCLITTRSTALLFAERPENGPWQFRPGISAWMDHQAGHQRPASAACRILGVLGVHDHYDLALLEVEPSPGANGALTPLAVATQAPARTEGHLVYLVSYPVRDARRNEPERLARIFRDTYNVKRVQPGSLRGVVPFRDVHLLRHDCNMLGQSAGGCLIDLESHQVLGLHVSGRYLEDGTAIPLWMLRDDPLLRRCHVTFAEATAQDLASVVTQVQRLARSRSWTETRDAVGNLYQRTFPSSSATTNP